MFIVPGAHANYLSSGAHANYLSLWGVRSRAGDGSSSTIAISFVINQIVQ